MDPAKIKPNLMIYGDLNGSCANCNNMDVKLSMASCPECQTAFKYYAFRSVKAHIPKILKLMDDNPVAVIVDHEDYKSALGASKAEEFLR